MGWWLFLEWRVASGFCRRLQIALRQAQLSATSCVIAFGRLSNRLWLMSGWCETCASVLRNSAIRAEIHEHQDNGIDELPNQKGLCETCFRGAVLRLEFQFAIKQRNLHNQRKQITKKYLNRKIPFRVPKFLKRYLSTLAGWPRCT